MSPGARVLVDLDGLGARAEQVCGQKESQAHVSKRELRYLFPYLILKVGANIHTGLFASEPRKS